MRASRCLNKDIIRDPFQDTEVKYTNNASNYDELYGFDKKAV